MIVQLCEVCISHATMCEEALQTVYGHAPCTRRLAMATARKACNIPARFVLKVVDDWSDFDKWWKASLVLLYGDEADRFASQFLLYHMARYWSNLGSSRFYFIDAHIATTYDLDELLSISTLVLSSAHDVSPKWLTTMLRARLNASHPTRTLITVPSPSLPPITDDFKSTAQRYMLQVNCER